MDLPELPEELRLGGAEYHKQLGKLGLHPEGLLWMFDKQAKRFVLWLMWSGVDRFGPFALTDLLFRAYRAAALTQAIDPFLVDVRGPADALSEGLRASMHTWPKGDTGEIRLEGPEDVDLYGWRMSWVYHYEKKRKTTLVVNRDWRRFNENVSKLAA